VEHLTWRKSSYSGSGGGQCVEAAASAGAILIRDTTNRVGTVLSVPTDAWQRLIDTLRQPGAPRQR
jgi:hypothetical protein